MDLRLAAMHALFVDYDGPCHLECAGDCFGPADHDCHACRHSRVLDRYGLHRCVPDNEDAFDFDEDDYHSDDESDEDVGDNHLLSNLSPARPSLTASLLLAAVVGVLVAG